MPYWYIQFLLAIGDEPPRPDDSIEANDRYETWRRAINRAFDEFYADDDGLPELR